jgi:hypothetical protein
MQFGPRAPLTPAETLLEPAMLRAIREQAPSPAATDTIVGTNPDAEIVLTTSADRSAVAGRAIGKLSALVAAKTLPQPTRTIRMAADQWDDAAVKRTVAVLHVSEGPNRAPAILRSLWSTPAIGDEVAELFGRHFIPNIEIGPYEAGTQHGYESYGIPTTTIFGHTTRSSDETASIVAATAYFLATLPNAGAEALLSHLTVGAHARLAEDGRKAVAQMGNQQRASADVLIMFSQAIEREQRRMRSFERFMPQPVDPMLRSRIADMEKGITSVWTSMGITSSPFVPAAKRIRGRGGEDVRIPSRVGNGPIKSVEPPTAFLKFNSPADILYELGNFVDGKRSISDIRDAVSAEFGSLPLPSVVDYFDRLAKSGAITIK